MQRVSVLMGEIATASHEQSQGIDQVNTAISEMDSVTQQNASLVEESSAAGRSLQIQAASLLKEVSFFKGAAMDQPQAALPATGRRNVSQPKAKLRPASHVLGSPQDNDDWASF